MANETKNQDDNVTEAAEEVTNEEILKDAGGENSDDVQFEKDTSNKKVVNPNTKQNSEAGDELNEEDALLKLQKMLDAKEDESKANLDRYMRTLAEYDNYRKRTQKEKSDMYDKGITDTVGKILDIADSFDRALAAINKDEIDDKTKSLYDGIEMLKKQFEKALGSIGVKEIEALGKEFDPNLHNAVTHVEDEALGENVVAEEFQKGYTYNDKVIRYSMVKVAN